MEDSQRAICLTVSVLLDLRNSEYCSSVRRPVRLGRIFTGGVGF
jgi:hypothetical protein